jgi:hypothetical protein
MRLIFWAIKLTAWLFLSGLFELPLVRCFGSKEI